MVDSIHSSPTNSLLRAQQVQQAQATQTRAPQAVVNQSRAAAVAPVKASATPQTVIVASANRNLPRGSIVDQLV